MIFSEPVSDFADDDVTLSGTANPATATVEGIGTTYIVTVRGMTGERNGDRNRGSRGRP